MQHESNSVFDIVCESNDVNTVPNCGSANTIYNSIHGSIYNNNGNGDGSVLHDNCFTNVSCDINNIFCFEFIVVRAKIIDFNKKQHVSTFFLKNVKICCTTSEKNLYEINLQFLILFCFSYALDEKSDDKSVYDTEVYESALFEKEIENSGFCGGWKQVAMLFALKTQDTVRKQRHSLLLSNIFLNFYAKTCKNEAAQHFVSAKNAKCSLILEHSQNENSSLSQCLLQETELQKFFFKR